jgi:hypothetical protein
MDKTCVIATVLFVVSNVLTTAYRGAFESREHFDSSLYKQLDTSYIQTEWEWRIEHRQLELFAAIFNCLAWFSFSIPILQVAWIQSSRCKEYFTLHVTVALLAIAGSLTELVSHLLFVGSTNSLEWMSKRFTLDGWAGGETTDGIGWKTIEVLYTTARGTLLWVGAMEFFFLSGIFALLFVSIRSKSDSVFSTRWASFGGFLALLCLVDFLGELLRFESGKLFTVVSGFSTFLNRTILFPIWIVWLGKQLPKAHESIAQRVPTDLELS